MADNVAITAGVGTTIATDEVADAALGTVQVQYTKLMDGTLDGTNKASVGATGALSVESKEARRMGEHQLLACHAERMLALDPLRGFEVR